MKALQAITGKTGEELKKAFFEGNATQAFSVFIEGLGRIQRSGGDVTAALSAMGLEGTRAVQVLATLATRSEVLNDALGQANIEWEANIALNKEAAAAAKSFSAQAQIVANAADEAASAIGAMLAPVALDALGEFRDASFYVAENLEMIVDVAEYLAIVIGTRLAIAATTAAIAISKQSAASLAATTTTSIYTGAITRTTVAMNAMAVSARVASAAIALMGGPIGAAVLAAVAIGAYIVKTQSAAGSTRNLKERVDELTAGYKSLSEASRQVELDKIFVESRAITQRLEEAQRSLIEAEKELEKQSKSTASGFLGMSASAVQADTKTIRLKATISSLKTELEALNQAKEELLSNPFGDIGDPFEDPVGFVPKEKIDSGPQDLGSKDQKEIDRLSAITASMERELQLRQRINEIYRSADLDLMTNQFEQERALLDANRQEQLATLEAQYAEDQARRELEKLEVLEKFVEDQERTKIIKEEYRQQELTADQIFQEEKTAIELKAARDREKIAQQEANAKIGTYTGFANASLKLIQAFGSQSFQSQKNFSIATSFVNIAGGVAHALNNPYPANLGFAAQVALEGASLISTMKSANPQSGASSISAGSSTPPTQNQQGNRGIPESQSNQSFDRTLVVAGLEDDTITNGAFVKKMLKQIEEVWKEGEGIGRIVYQ